MMKIGLLVVFLCLFQLDFVHAENAVASTKVVASAAVAGTQANSSTMTSEASLAESVKPEVSKLAEDQIPLSIEATKKVSDTSSSTAKALMSMMIVVILLATSYYFIRKYKFSNTINKSNMQIKVLSQHYLGPKKSLAIVHVAGESILIGVTDSNISMIKSLSLIDDEVPAHLPNTFGQTISTVEKTTATEVLDNNLDKNKAFELDEEFSLSNVTDTVSKKIKSMRSFS